MDEGLLNDLLECSVCLERLDTSSRVLPCQHTFCIKCLKEIVQSHKVLRCPECRVLVEVRMEDLPPNVLLMRILEGMRGRSGGATNNVTPSKPPPNPLQPITSPINPSLHHQQKLMMPYNHSRQKDGSNIAHFQDPNNLSNRNIGTSQQARIQQQDPNRQHTEYVVNNTTPYARAVYDYLSKDPGNLNFKKGDIIMLRRRIDTHWCYGESGGKQGAFPMTYAQVIVPLPMAATPQCKALYDFRMAAPDEDGCLAFDKGAVITVIRRVDENWAEGRLNERIGIFPIAFVEMNASARALMKISNSIGGRSAPAAPHAEPIMGVSMLQPNWMDQQVLNTYRQQQMSLSSPAPVQGSNPSDPHPMSQSQPLPINHHPQQQQQPQQPQTTANNASQQSSSGSQQSDPQNEPDLIQLVYGSISNAAQILVQNLQSANKHSNTNASSGQVNLAAQEAYQKARANIKQFQSLSSSYHATNNLGSDSSSSTTTPSFGGSSVTTTPNISSSNTSSSESNTPSSPASPATNALARTNVDKQAAQNSYSNVSVIQPPKQPLNVPSSAAVYTNVTVEDPNVSNRSHESSLDSSGNNSVLNTSNHSLLNTDVTRINITNNSPVQNISVESPPRSNMSSPQTLNNTVNVLAQPAAIVHSHSEMKCAQQSAGIYQIPTNNREIMQYSNSVYTLLSNTQSGSTSNPFLANPSLESTHNDDHTNVVSPRHGRDGAIVTSARIGGYQSHHHNREKRHSLTPGGGQTLAPPTNSAPNRHSMEYMLSGNNIAPVSSRIGPTPSTEAQPSHFFAEGMRKQETKRDREKEVKLPAPYVALYPYKPQKADELELKKGATYMVMERCYDGWYKGCLNGNPQKCGVFPGNYVAPAHLKSKHRSKGSSDAKSSGSKTGNSTAGSNTPSRKGESSTGEMSGNITQSSPAPQSSQPPDLPPRSGSPSNPAFPWPSTPKQSSSSSKSSEKSKEKSKSEKTPTSMSFMKRLAAMKKSKSPPPSSFTNSGGQNHGFSMDNPVFEDCSVPAQQPAHVRSGSCPSQLLQPENIEVTPAGPHATVGPTGAARLLNSSRAAHTLGPAHAAGPRVRTRPSLANATLTTPLQHVTQRSNDGPWHPISTSNRPQHQHRKSHSLDAGQQLRTRDSTATRERFRCIVPYPSNSEYELELQVDDVVVVHRKWGDGWYKGTHERTGRTGLFPASFVEAC